MVHDGLTSSFDRKHMVEQASFVARELGISREDQDVGRCARTSARWRRMDEGRFDDELVSVGDSADESPRRDTSSRSSPRSSRSSTRKARPPPATRPASTTARAA